MKRCLFVDDSAVVRKVAKRILAQEMAVSEASCGSEAVAMCQIEMPDLVVVDVSLPDMQAIDVIARIRAIPTQMPPQIMLMLVEVDLPSIMRAKRAGADGHFLKPFNRTQLLPRLRSIPAKATPAAAA